MQEALLIYNPAAGTLANVDQEGLLLRIANRFSTAGARLKTVSTSPEKPAGAIATEAAKAGSKLLIIAGGDGTVSDAASALVHTDVRLGILPLGTYNNIARCLGISFDPMIACEQIMAGSPAKIDVGLVNGKHYFLEAAGVGLDAALFPLAEHIKQGTWRSYLEAAEIFSKFEPFRVAITLDHAPARRGWFAHRHRLYTRAWVILCANSPFYGPACEVSPDSSLDDGILTLHLFRQASRLAWAFNMMSRVGGGRKVRRISNKFTVKRVKISGPIPQPLHVDGVVREEWPIEIECLPAALNVIRGAAQEAEEKSGVNRVGKDPKSPLNKLTP